MKIKLSFGERSSVKIALKNYLEELNSTNNKDNVIKEMIENTESAIKTFDKAEKSEAKKYLKEEI